MEAKLTNRVRTAGVVRSCVADIEQFLNPFEQEGQNGKRIALQHTDQKYGTKIVDKLRVMGEIIKELPMPAALDNDEYIQAFDKNGIERRLKKLRLRRKILSRNKKISQDDLHSKYCQCMDVG